MLHELHPSTSDYLPIPSYKPRGCPCPHCANERNQRWPCGRQKENYFPSWDPVYPYRQIEPMYCGASQTDFH